VAIPQALFERTLKQRLARGGKDTPQLRAAIKEELISRELLAQEALKSGLDKSPSAQDQISQARQAILIQLLVAEKAAQNPITDAQVKAEYDRQIAALGEPGSVMEYRLRLAVLKDEAEARDVLARVRKGESFEKLTKDRSIDRSKEQGGLLDWLLPNQMIPAISNVVVNLSKGTVAAAPVRTPTGWTVFKIEDTRKFKAPTLEESKARIKRALEARQNAEYMRTLRSSAKVVQ
jgi:peptidyl-prolyl cis-trans isomerase C